MTYSGKKDSRCSEAARRQPADQSIIDHSDHGSIKRRQQSPLPRLNVEI